MPRFFAMELLLATVFCFIGLSKAFSDDTGGFQKVDEYEKEQSAPSSEEKSEVEKEADEAKKQEALTKAEVANLGNYSGEVFTVRSAGKTEVFFRNHSQSYFIPKGNTHNTMLKEIQKKAKANQRVSISFNPKTREIKKLDDAKVATPSSSSAAVESAGSGQAAGK